MADPREQYDDIQPEDIIVLRPGELPPPVMVILDTGRLITLQEFEQMELENNDDGDM